MIRLIDLLKEAVLVDKIPTTTLLQESLQDIKKLSDKTLLTRESRGIKSGAALLSTEGYKKGRIGLIFDPKSVTYKPNIVHQFEAVINKFNMTNIVYCSHGNVRFHLAGQQYYMVPKGDYKTVWSPEVKDIYADLAILDDEGDTKNFPIDSYTDSWPTGDVPEVLVDCKEYYLISTRIPIINSWMKKNKISQPQTYSDLYIIIEGAIQPYI